MMAKALIKVTGKAERRRGKCVDGENNKGPPCEGRVCAVFKPCAASKRV